MTPSVSVIVATYNRAELLPRAVDSVLAQTYTDWELLIIDDGSSDGTFEVAEAYQQRDRRIRLVQAGHRGLAGARNVGLQHAQGRYVAFLDDDDVFLKEKLMRQSTVLDRRPELGFVYSLVQHRDDRGRVFDVPKDPGATFLDLFEGRAPYVHGVLARRDVIDQVGRFREHLPCIEDYDLWLRMAAVAPFDFTRDMVAICHRHAGNMSRDIRRMTEVSLEVLTSVTRWRQLGVPADAYRRRLGLLHYELARMLCEEGSFYRAGAEFFRAVCWRPDIGMLARAYQGQAPQHEWRRALKPYFAIPYCAVRGAINGGPRHA